MSIVPRRSREVHAEGLLRAINDAGPVEYADGGINVDRTYDAVRADDLALLESDPAEFFRRTHKPMPVGYRAPE